MHMSTFVTYRLPYLLLSCSRAKVVYSTRTLFHLSISIMNSLMNCGDKSGEYTFAQDLNKKNSNKPVYEHSLVSKTSKFYLITIQIQKWNIKILIGVMLNKKAQNNTKNRFQSTPQRAKLSLGKTILNTSSYVLAKCTCMPSLMKSCSSVKSFSFSNGSIIVLIPERLAFQRQALFEF